MDLSKWRKLSLIIYATYMICFYQMIILDIRPFSLYASAIGLIGNIMCFPMFLHGISVQPDNYKSTWKYFLTGAFMYFIGELIWAYHANILGAEPESPSICDIFYILNTCICFVGLMSYLRQIKTINLMSISFDMLISAFAVGGMIYYFIILPILRGEESDLFMLALNLYSPLIDFVLLVGLLALFFQADNKRFLTKMNLLIALAFMAAFVIDQTSLIIAIYQLPVNLILEPLWSLYYFTLAMASLYPEANIKTEKAPSYLTTTLEYLRILLPYIFTFVILFMVGQSYKILNSIFLWAMILVIMMSLRQIFVLLNNRRLMQRIRHNEEKLNLQNLELKKLNQKILHDAEVDFLTQLSNRRYIDKSFERLMPPDGQFNSLGLMLIDVDYFKQINDTFGHQVGDHVLQNVAYAIRSVIRTNDIAGRFGGDEFIILLPGANINITETIAKNLTEYVNNDKLLKEKKVTLSIGCTCCQVTDENYSTQNILKQADDALYEAKEKGRNQYVLFNA